MGGFLKKVFRETGRILHQTEKHILRPVAHAVRAPLERTQHHVVVTAEPLVLGMPTTTKTGWTRSIPLEQVEAEMLREGIPADIARATRDNLRFEREVRKSMIVPVGPCTLRILHVSAACDEQNMVAVSYTIAEATVNAMAGSTVSHITKGSVIGIRTHRSAHTAWEPRPLTADEEARIMRVLSEHIDHGT